jgi:aryl-alcohol dehydrogenase-like predicted oxidoreductase
MVSASKDEAEKIFDLYVSSGGNFIDTGTPALRGTLC